MAEHLKSKSTGGFHQGDGSPCTSFKSEVFLTCPLNFLDHSQVETVAPTDRVLSAPTFRHNGYAVPQSQPPIKYEQPPPQPPQQPVQQRWDWVEGAGFNVIEVTVDTVDRAGNQIVHPGQDMPDLGLWRP